MRWWCCFEAGQLNHDSAQCAWGDQHDGEERDGRTDQYPYDAESQRVPKGQENEDAQRAADYAHNRESESLCGDWEPFESPSGLFLGVQEFASQLVRAGGQHRQHERNG